MTAGIEVRATLAEERRDEGGLSLDAGESLAQGGGELPSGVRSDPARCQKRCIGCLPAGFPQRSQSGWQHRELRPYVPPKGGRPPVDATVMELIGQLCKRVTVLGHASTIGRAGELSSAHSAPDRTASPRAASSPAAMTANGLAGRRSRR